MAAYADYAYYSGTFLGTAIASASFSRLALRATEKLDQICYDRLAEIVTAATDTATITKIKNACCSVAEEIQAQEANGNQDGVTSERVGNYSVTFGNKSRNNLSNDEKIIAAAKVYLGNTGLMFSGFAEGEYGCETDDEN
jgi:hypothetical protein